MLKPLLWAAGSLLAAASALGAQGASIDPVCSASSLGDLATQDACQKTIDVYRFLAPQLSLAIAGGNVVPGEAAALDGIGHISLGFRITALRASLPRPDLLTPALTGAVASDMRVDHPPFGMAVLDVAVGLFPGLAVTGSRALALDALVNASYVPSLHQAQIDVAPSGGSLHLGYGARLTLLDESIVTPAITAEVARRDLPTTSLAISPGPDRLAARNLHARTTQWRGLVGKHLGTLLIVIGGGQDRDNSSADITVDLLRSGTGLAAGPIPVTQHLTRTTVFADLSLGLSTLRLTAEVGRAGATSAGTFNTFGSEHAGDAQNYASLGVRVHW